MSALKCPLNWMFRRFSSRDFPPTDQNLHIKVIGSSKLLLGVSESCLPKKEPNDHTIALVAANSNKRIMSFIVSEVITLRADWLCETGLESFRKNSISSSFCLQGPPLLIFLPQITILWSLVDVYQGFASSNFYLSFTIIFVLFSFAGISSFCKLRGTSTMDGFCAKLRMRPCWLLTSFKVMEGYRGKWSAALCFALRRWPLRSEYHQFDKYCQPKHIHLPVQTFWCVWELIDSLQTALKLQWSVSSWRDYVEIHTPDNNNSVHANRQLS